MAKRKQDELMHDDGTYVVKKSRKKNIVAFILCVLVALIVWLYASNVEQKLQEEAKLPNNSVMSADTTLDETMLNAR